MADRTAPGALLLVQELANTLDIRTGADALGTTDGLAAFVREHGLTADRLGKRDLPGLRALREALRAACLAHAGAPMPDAAAAELAALLAAAPLVLDLDPAGAATLRPAPALSGLPAFTARIAAAIAAAPTTWPRLRACAAGDCHWVYYDRSPAGRGRWCDMSTCGSRAKMRAYRTRHP